MWVKSAWTLIGNNLDKLSSSFWYRNWKNKRLEIITWLCRVFFVFFKSWWREKGSKYHLKHAIIYPPAKHRFVIFQGNLDPLSPPPPPPPSRSLQISLSITSTLTVLWSTAELLSSLQKFQNDFTMIASWPDVLLGLNLVQIAFKNDQQLHHDCRHYCPASQEWQSDVVFCLQLLSNLTLTCTLHLS